MNKRRRNGRNKSGKLPERGNKNMRRDAEIADTARKEFQADSRERRDCYRSQDNDPAWYAQNPQLLRDYASFPFGKAVGSKLGQGMAPNQSIPGVKAFYFAPTVGQPLDANAPINIAARNIYSFVRHANSGHSNYEAPDLMIYLICMDSIYMYHAFLKRILGLLLDYSTLNRYYPQSIVQAMGVDFNDVSMHIQDFRGFINQYAVKMGSMCVPNSMSYMARHVWMCEGLYVDSMTTKAQTYFYTPCAFIKFQRNSTTQAGGTVTSAFVSPQFDDVLSNLKTFQDLVAFGNDLLNLVLQEEDFNIMSGDILKAFGPEGVVKVSGVAEGYMVLPSYNLEVLSQMENATVFHGQYSGGLTQNTSIDGGYLQITSNPFLEVHSSNWGGGNASPQILNSMFGAYQSEHILNFHTPEVTPEMVMVATRLTNVADKYTSSTPATDLGSNHLGYFMSIPTVGSEIICASALFYYTWSSTGVMTLVMQPDGTVPYYEMPIGDSDSILTGITALNDLARAMTFDWHHAVYPVIAAQRGTQASFISYPTSFPALDVDNYTFITQQNLINMTTAALLSQFSVPQMGAFAQKLV